MKRITTVVLAILLLIGFTKPVFAEGEPEPTLEPTVEPEEEQEKLNPVVRWIADFFKDLFLVETPQEPVETTTPETTPETDETPVPTEEVPTPQPTLSVEEQIAAYHEDELGFGVLVKLLSIAEAAKAECAATSVNCDVTIDTLVEQFKAGVGIGDLEALYGKPDVSGVGQVKGTPDPEQNQNRVQNENRNTNQKNLQNEHKTENKNKNK